MTSRSYPESAPISNTAGPSRYHIGSATQGPQCGPNLCRHGISVRYGGPVIRDQVCFRVPRASPMRTDARPRLHSPPGRPADTIARPVGPPLLRVKTTISTAGPPQDQPGCRPPRPSHHPSSWFRPPTSTRQAPPSSLWLARLPAARSCLSVREEFSVAVMGIPSLHSFIVISL